LTCSELNRRVVFRSILISKSSRKTMALFLEQRSRSSESCSICLEDLKNRRRLPCLHSFCLGCLENHCKNKLPGDDALCPLCRATFRIPQNGVSDLKDPADGRDSEKTCEVCSTDQNTTPATAYCVDCCQLLCERCSLPHKKMPGKPHSLRKLVEPDAHEKPDVVACRKAILQVESKSRKFSESVKETKRQVIERGEAVKRVVDGHVKRLLDQIDVIESDAKKEANAITETLTALSDTVDSHAEHSSSMNPFATRTPELEELIMTCIIASCYSAPDLAFVPSDIDELTGDEGNIVGSVHKTAKPGK